VVRDRVDISAESNETADRGLGADCRRGAGYAPLQTHNKEMGK